MRVVVGLLSRELNFPAKVRQTDAHCRVELDPEQDRVWKPPVAYLVLLQLTLSAHGERTRDLGNVKGIVA